MQWLEGLTTVCIATSDFGVTGENASIFLDGAWIKAAAKRFYKQGFFLEDVTCLDMEEGYVVLYHFDHFDSPGRITVRVIADREDPTVPSIADIYQGAEWHERECMDFYPVVFKGNPNPSRLLLPDDMEEKPLVKADGKRQSMLGLLRFTELDPCAGDYPLLGQLEERLAAIRAEAEAAEAAAVAEKEAAEAAAVAEKEAAEAAEGDAAVEDEAE
ncbi:MAG: NADH-quinone oxidoreductase subunit C [Proteobacteria bacterium]|nr:NADH-quinone oxidoreductase subunit C [Pseudomonadota bacterium]